jgi:hypothetical protein
VGCVVLATLLMVVSVARSEREQTPARPVDERPPVYGPGAYAGPGSLGGTKSALDPR